MLIFKYKDKKLIFEKFKPGIKFYIGIKEEEIYTVIDIKFNYLDKDFNMIVFDVEAIHNKCRLRSWFNVSRLNIDIFHFI